MQRHGSLFHIKWNGADSIMLERHDAFPDPIRDHMIRTEVNGRLKGGISYLLDVVELNSINVALVRSAIEALDPASKFSGMVHVLHNRLLHYIKTNELRGVVDTLESFSDFEYKDALPRTIGMFVSGYKQRVHQLYYDTCCDGVSNTYGSVFDGIKPTDQELLGSQGAVAKALERLRAVNEPLYSELETLLSDVMIMHSPTMNAATSVNSLGIVRMSQLREGQTWTRYYESLVHEAAHQHLNFLWFSDPIILNEDSGKYASPLRREPRPLSGIYHAMFVLGRTMLAINLLKRSADYDPEGDRIQTAYNNANNPASFEDKFNDCWTVLKDHARLTEFGKKLMKNTREMAFF